MRGVINVVADMTKAGQVGAMEVPGGRNGQGDVASQAWLPIPLAAFP